MAEQLRVGLVGADADGRGWGPVAHIPALGAIDDMELAAVCTSRPESAAAAGKAYGVPGYHDIEELVAQPDIDLVAVVVRVPFHHDIVIPALDAEKHVFCEWPLGANLTEAQDMAELAQKKGVVTAVGLQGRQDPALAYLRDLYHEGWFGDIVSVHMSMFGSGLGKSDSRSVWMGDAASGANFVTIAAGHTIDYLDYCIGPLAELSGTISTRVLQWELSDTGETVGVNAPDGLLAKGVLEGGGLVSVHAASVPFHGSNWRMEVYGTKGTIVASTTVMPQISRVRLTGAQGDEPMRELSAPGRGDDHDVPEGPAGNIARAYRRIAEAIRAGGSFQPDFGHAVGLHRLMESLAD